MARRMVGWAPEGARALLEELAQHQRDDASQANANELLTHALAATGAWPLATESLQRAIALRRALGDPVQADRLDQVLERFPVPGFSSEQQAVDVEIALIRRSIERTASAADVMTVELARAIAPRWLPGDLQAWFSLSPDEMTLLSAAVASIGDPRCGPPRTAAAWHALLASASDAADALIDARLVSAMPALIPNPRVVSRMLGRTQVEPPRSIRLIAQPRVLARSSDGSLARELRMSHRFGVVVGPSHHARARAVAIAAGCQLTAVVAEPVGAAVDPSLIADAALEARLFGGMLVIDEARWRAAGLDVTAAIAGDVLRSGSILVVTDEELPIDQQFRAFTVTAAVSSTQ
ncbi:MAG: hypothetical protein AB7O24_33255 [Kofleriaceae bacterium]